MVIAVGFGVVVRPLVRYRRRLEVPMRLGVLAMVMAACTSSGSSGEWFEIDAGDHSSTARVSVHSGDELDFFATFDPTAEYTTDDPANQGDINKLYGFSDCDSHHHTNSARFGWRWYDDELQIFAYTYADGIRDWEQLGVVGFGGAHHYRLESVGDQYRFSLDGGPEVVMDRGCTSTLVRYRLYPYFGGDETAPHDIRIHID